jgi:RNA polymerase sigma-70 factor (ECF subfamily)
MATAGQIVEPEIGKPAGRPEFAEALRSNKAMVFSMAFHFLRDSSAAEEVAQDVFLQLYRNLESLESEAHVTYWLRRVTSNRCIDYARKRKSQAAVGLDSLPEIATKSDPSDPMLNRRLQALVSSLAETPRMIMILRYQEDQMPEDIARLLKMPVRTVKSHLHRSLTILREKIGRSMGEIR